MGRKGGRADMADEKERATDENLEPEDRSETFSGIDWCLAMTCGCGACLDPTGCFDALSQGCLGCLHSCLSRLGCGVLSAVILITSGLAIFGP